MKGLSSSRYDLPLRSHRESCHIESGCMVSCVKRVTTLRLFAAIRQNACYERHCMTMRLMRYTRCLPRPRLLFVSVSVGRARWSCGEQEVQTVIDGCEYTRVLGRAAVRGK